MSDPSCGQWFVVEGPDGAGKTTVAKELAYLLAHRPDPRPCVLHCLDYNSTRDEYIGWPGDWTYAGLHVVQDRGALSGPVYEPLIRGDMDRLLWLDPLVEQTAEAGALMIYMDADLTILQERLNARGDDYVTEDHLADIQAGYKVQLKRWAEAGGSVHRFDTTWAFPSVLEITMAAFILTTPRG